MEYVTQARQPLLTLVADPNADWHSFIIDPRRPTGTAVLNLPTGTPLIGRLVRLISTARPLQSRQMTTFRGAEHHAVGAGRDVVRVLRDLGDPLLFGA